MGALHVLVQCCSCIRIHKHTTSSFQIWQFSIAWRFLLEFPLLLLHWLLLLPTRLAIGLQFKGVDRDNDWGIGIGCGMRLDENSVCWGQYFLAFVRTQGACQFSCICNAFEFAPASLLPYMILLISCSVRFVGRSDTFSCVWSLSSLFEFKCWFRLVSL